ncbi:membrane hypothetical protein [Vibrio crassostreae]|nr:membrane hypothetical protein [Vibrio crassostreae]CAK2311653.1 membrane hypothetical protein [Vibrio crassostreae]CAK2329799.1 membrane hypothetical protein [Vibrio crassostreae]CAK3254105.1 membrane hypothetical protein [Vibrio crassostreae]
MPSGLKTYTTIFVLFGSISYWLFVNDQGLMASFQSLLNVISTAAITLLSVILAYVFQQIRVVKSIKELGSKETAQVGAFGVRYHRRLFLTFSFYGFMLLSGVIIGNLTFESEATMLLVLSAYAALFVVQMSTLASIYNLLKSIEIFETYILLRQAKKREKEDAMKLLLANDEFSEVDKAYFNGVKRVINHT